MKWFDVFIVDSIHSWEQFRELFLHARQDYEYEELCDGIKYIQREEYESIANFNSRIIQNYYRFHNYD